MNNPIKILGLNDIGLGPGSHYFPYERPAIPDVSKTRKEAVEIFKTHGLVTRRGAIASILLACAAPSIIIGQSSVEFRAWNANVPVSSGSCTTSRDSALGTANNRSHMGYWAWAFQFTAGASYTACACDVYVSKVGSPVNNLDVEIWSDSTNTVGSNLGSSGTIASSSLTTYTTDAAIPAVTFTGISAAIISGTKYWMILHPSTLSGSTNYSNWARIGSIQRLLSTTTAYPTGWAAPTAGDCGKFQLYSS